MHALPDPASYEQFEQELREALTRLYDPAYQASPFLRQLLLHAGLTKINGMSPKDAFHSGIIEAIKSLKPDAEIPSHARIRRFYELLESRYIQELTQEETAERLGITPRHLRREQQLAVRMLALSLWQKWQAQTSARQVPDTPADAERGRGDAWRSQVRQELAALEEGNPGAVSEVGQVVAQIIELERALATRHGCTLGQESIVPGLVVPLHLSVLRQLLIIAIQKMIAAIEGGHVTIAAHAEGDTIHLDVLGEPAHSGIMPSSEFIAETVIAHGGEVKVSRQGEQLCYTIILPTAQLCTVLVVDDNADLVHFYRRSTERTRFHMEHVSEGKQVLETIRRVRPDVVVLDVMLPDIDGWEVLTHLHGNPETRSIPVIVCSVVHQEELALALGARRYLSKPVRRQELISALEEALLQG